MNTFLDKISFKQTFLLSFITSLLFGLILNVFLTKQETKISSEAYLPPQFIKTTNQKFGSIPNSPPQIYRVFPWLGKSGDTIWIQGKNFGKNPIKKILQIGNISIPPQNIDSWQDDQIQFSIPPGLPFSTQIKLKIGDYPFVSTLPITIYNRNTKIKIGKQNNFLTIKTPSNLISKIKIWFGDENTPTELLESTVLKQNKKILKVNTQNKPILSILLLDINNKPLPYYLNPLEFGF